MELQRKTFLVTEKQLQMIEEIKKKNGIPTMTEVFRSAISALYEKTFKYGEDPLNTATLDDSPEAMARKAKAKADAKLALKEAEEAAKLKPKIDMCINMLGGEIETNEAGDKFCRFTQYHAFGDDQRPMLPLRQVAPIISETSLFVPDRETVFKRRPEVKKLFAKLEKNNG